MCYVLCATSADKCDDLYPLCSKLEYRDPACNLYGSTMQSNLPYSQNYWRELNLAVEPKSLLQEY